MIEIISLEFQQRGLNIFIKGIAKGKYERRVFKALSHIS